ncbi:MAG: hypothetical protein Q8P93_04075 [bacterium]|nr:hypothetical protein [bacterium]
MKKILTLQMICKGEKHFIDFGIATTSKEILDIQYLRQYKYAQKKYFAHQYAERIYDEDCLDKDKKTVLLLAQLDGKETIGTVRIIQPEILPTEEYFSFVEPSKIKNIPRYQRAEISRLVITRSKDKIDIPRNLVLLFLIQSMISVAKQNGICGGYAFLKAGIRGKLRYLNIPIHYIRNYTQHYPGEEILAPYFNDPKDKVIPIYFLVEEINNYLEKQIHNKKMFVRIDEKTYRLRKSLYTFFLRTLGVI